MAEALSGGLLQFNLESLDEAEMLSGVAVGQGSTARVGFRINPEENVYPMVPPGGANSQMIEGEPEGVE